ncbi:MAG: T9SS C-terminal target domain-containing protein [Bacteroidetes bacterium]|nr:MAG: T9SS C-terminal target domain-containing protein [Bacteroidota bacterium]
MALFLLFGKVTLGQDTIRVMQYNLLFYGLYTDFCTPENNNVDDKDEYLRTLLGHFQPDIFTVNELGRGAHNLTRIRDNVLNINGVDYFEYATYTNTGNGWFANGLFYDSRKFGLYNEVIVNTVLRDINLYTLYYKTDDLALTQDTVFLTLIVAHLKAGQSASDQQTRTTMVTNVMNYLDDNDYKGNIMFMGDFNMKSSFEQAYQLMVNNPNQDIRFIDPIGVTGVWGNNSDMAPYHTQSPHTGSHPCYVTGGLDDRYDFILATKPIMEGSMGFQYIEDSYQAIGQDGLRFNQSLINPPNNSQPPEIIEALYLMSDHLPVMLDMVTVDVVTSLDHYPFEELSLTYPNPVGEKLRISLNSTKSGSVILNLYSLTGKLLISESFHYFEGSKSVDINVSHLSSGLYLLKFQSPDGYVSSHKIIKH